MKETEIYEGFGERIWPIQSTRKPRNRKMIMSKRNKLLAIKHNRIRSKLPELPDEQVLTPPVKKDDCVHDYNPVHRTCSKCGVHIYDDLF